MPDYRHVFVLNNGETIIVPQRDAVRVLDRRGEWEQPQVCWEITLPSGVVRKVWPEELSSWEAELR